MSPATNSKTGFQIRFSTFGRTLFLGSQIIAIVVVFGITSFVVWRALDKHRERQAMETAFKVMKIPNPGPILQVLGESDYEKGKKTQTFWWQDGQD